MFRDSSHRQKHVVHCSIWVLLQMKNMVYIHLNDIRPCSTIEQLIFLKNWKCCFLLAWRLCFSKQNLTAVFTFVKILLCFASSLSHDFHCFVFSTINEGKKKTKKLVHFWNFGYNFVLTVEFKIRWVPNSTRGEYCF